MNLFFIKIFISNSKSVYLCLNIIKNNEHEYNT